MKTTWQLLCLTALIWLAPSSTQADDTAPVPKTAAEIDQTIINEVKDRQEIMTNLTYISDVIGPRMTGSANLKKANDWTMEKFKSYGIENVRLEPYTIPAGWERGFARMKMVEPNTGRWLAVASRAWTPGTQGKLTGEVIFLNASSLEDLNKYKGKLKNAVIMRNKPANITPILEIGKPRDPNSTPRQRPNFAGGGAGRELMQAIDQMLRAEGVACTITDSAKPHGLLNMTGSWGGRDRTDAAEPLPNLFMSHDDYAMLYRLITRKDAEPVKVEVEIEAKIIPGPITVYNTIGEIKGSEKPDEFVVIGAHLDSWDLGQGTTDNGTGSSVVLEAARTLGKLAKAGIRPKRTIRVCLFSGEEEGLHGSTEYVKLHKDEMSKTSMALVHDTGTGRVLSIALQGRSVLKPLFEKELPALKELKVEINTSNQGGTDHLPFDKVGVPGFAFKQDPAEYYLTHHSQSDTLDKAREPDLIQGAQVMAVTAMRIANLPDLLSREKKQPEETKPDAEKKTEPEKKVEGEKKP
ncbi:MAG TPA: M28 family peptidase [Gemmatales bacterium]|nr:M28 family peptidase [Gemmatales bacterium]